MKLTESTIMQAYLFLKRNVYHENLNLFLKYRVAEFEKSKNFKGSLKKITDVLNKENPSEDYQFKQWLKQVDYHLLPKAIVRSEDKKQNTHNKNSGLFLSNVTVSPEYEVSKVNYLINAPIELHIIEILWCLIVGPVAEVGLTEDCYGNRLHENASQFVEGIYNESNNKTSCELFKRYIDRYNSWRDNAIDCATQLAENDDVALFSLDLKSYYYHIDINFKKLKISIDEYYKKPEIALLAHDLTDALKKINSTFFNVIKDNLSVTHKECGDKFGLPIGFSSSSILSNWYLSGFDNDIGTKVRPAYYGRYVDDMLMVFKRPNIDAEHPIKCFVKDYLKGFIKPPLEDGTLYEISVDKNKLPIQNDKLILQYFDKEHSKAGLEVFKKELEERSSAFKFLPEDHMESELDKFAYDVIYDGSANKLRSVVGLAENETELAKYLSSHIIAHRLCEIGDEKSVLPQLKEFFRGANILHFSRLWEKVYQYAVILGYQDFAVSFFGSINDEVSKVLFIKEKNVKKHKKITNKIQKDLQLYNQLSLSLCLGLLNISPFDRKSFSLVGGKEEKLTKIQKFSVENNLTHFIQDFRNSNLIRHSLVAWPLANFTRYMGDLTNQKKFRDSNVGELDTRKIGLSPRFLHFDEFQVFSLNQFLCGQDKEKPDNNDTFDGWLSESVDVYKSYAQWDDSSVNYEKNNKSKSSPNTSRLIVGDKGKKSSLRVALANMIIPLSDIESSIREDKKPNISYKRQADLYRMLNEAVREKADIIIFPEVSIPVSWLPFVVSHARRHQIGIVFGLELWSIDGYVYNLLIEALPFKASGKYKSCAMTARVKNHYAPAELDLIDTLRLKPANLLNNSNYYHKVHWRGVCFATYNCFELSDIEHRTLFKSEIDMLIACVWNRDTNYYQHILESAVRDIHCYVIQSNTSQYGGSCVLRPTKTETKMMLYVKGGNNPCVLTSDVDIKALRDFQYKSKPGKDDIFKHLPPGFKHENVLKR